MSVVYCALMSKADRFEEDLSYNQTYNHEWLVKTNAKTDGLLAVRSGSLTGTPHPIPAMWSTYSHPVTMDADLGSYLQQKTITRLTSRDDDFNYWKVVCTWGPLSASGGGGAARLDPDPTAWPVEFSLEWASHTKFVEEDIYGRKLENTAETPFDPYEIDDDRPVLVAVKNISSLTSIINLAITYKNAINDATFYGAPAYTAKVESIVSGALQSAGGINYYPMTIRIQFTNEDEWDGWDVRLSNVGPECFVRDPDDPENWEADYITRVRELRKDGTPKTNGELLSSAKLDAEGYQLPPGSAGIVVPLLGTGTANLPWRFYHPKSFAGLGIGTGA